jgi:hypothetical protein
MFIDTPRITLTFYQNYQNLIVNGLSVRGIIHPSDHLPFCSLFLQNCASGSSCYHPMQSEYALNDKPMIPRFSQATRYLSSRSNHNDIIPRTSETHRSYFVGGLLSNDLIERGNRRFVCRQTVLIGVRDHKLIRSFSKSSHVDIPCDIELARANCKQFGP